MRRSGAVEQRFGCRQGPVRRRTKALNSGPVGGGVGPGQPPRGTGGVTAVMGIARVPPW